MTIRCLHLHAGNLYGGVERILSTLASWPDAPAQVASSFGLSYQGRLALELTAAGAPVSVLGPTRLSRPWTVWHGRRRAESLMVETAPDLAIVHSDWSQAVYGPAVQARGIPLVRWHHAPPGGPAWLQRWAERTPGALSICTSEYTRAGLGDASPAIVVHPPVPPPPESAQAQRQALRAEMGISGHETVIIQVGRLEWLKGHEVFLRALAKMLDYPAWTAWIVGGAQRDSEQRYLGSLGVLAAQLGVAQRIRFLGERADTAAWFAAADVACQPNVAPDAFGMTQVEAMYAGLPVVSSDAGGAPEVLDHTCGILVPPGDADALAGALRALVEERSLRTRLGAAGPARARLLCDPGQQVAKLASALTSVIPCATLGA